MTSETKAKARLRRMILRFLDGWKGSDPRGGQWIADEFANIQDVDDLMLELPEVNYERLMLQLLTDLVNDALISEIDGRQYKAEKRDLRHLKYAITAKGTALLAEAIPVNPLVADPRIG